MWVIFGIGLYLLIWILFFLFVREFDRGTPVSERFSSHDRQDQSDALKGKNSSKKKRFAKIIVVIACSLLVLISIPITVISIHNSNKSNETQERKYPILVENYSEEVHPGGRAYIDILGKPNTTYNITVWYSSGASKAAGLYPQKSDESGKVSWSWTVGGNTHSGIYSIVISDGEDKITIKFKVK